MSNKSPIVQLIELYTEKAEAEYSKHLETMHTDYKTSERHFDKYFLIENLKEQIMNDFITIEKNYYIALIEEIQSTVIKGLATDKVEHVDQ